MTTTLRVTLNAPREPFVAGEPITLTSTFTNTGSEPLALAFWWNRRMRVWTSEGHELTPGPGPVLPCGVAEALTVLAPGESVERAEPLQCTQPAGVTAPVGWSYTLAPGRYQVALVYEAPPPHGFTQHDTDPREPRGRFETAPAAIEVVQAPARSWLSRVLG